jgi:hypothetical protein
MAHLRMPAGRGIMGEITIRQPQVPQDDVPGEYLDKKH